MERSTYRTVSPLPGILRWFEVESVANEEISPIEHACETVANKNAELRHLMSSSASESVRMSCSSAGPASLVASQPVEDADGFGGPGSGTSRLRLTQSLQGVIDAAVNGGVAKYASAFFTADFEDKTGHVPILHSLLAEQVKVLESALAVHERLASKDILPLHVHLMETFERMKANLPQQIPAPAAGMAASPGTAMRGGNSSSSIIHSPLPPVPRAPAGPKAGRAAAEGREGSGNSGCCCSYSYVRSEMACNRELEPPHLGPLGPGGGPGGENVYSRPQDLRTPRPHRIGPVRPDSANYSSSADEDGLLGSGGGALLPSSGEASEEEALYGNYCQVTSSTTPTPPRPPPPPPSTTVLPWRLSRGPSSSSGHGSSGPHHHHNHFHNHHGQHHHHHHHHGCHHHQRDSGHVSIDSSEDISAAAASAAPPPPLPPRSSGESPNPENHTDRSHLTKIVIK